MLREKLKSRLFRPLLLLAALLALSQTASANWRAHFYGSKPSTGPNWESWKEDAWAEDDKKAEVKIEGESGDVYFRIYCSSSNANYCPKSGANQTLIPIVGENVYSRETKKGTDGAFHFVAEANKTYYVKFDRSAYDGNGQVEIWTESSSSPVTKSYTVNFLTGSGTQVASQVCEGGKTVTLSASMNTGSEFYFNIYEGTNYKGNVMPQSNTDVTNGSSTTDCSGGAKYIWKGGNGTVKATLTLTANGTVSSISFEGPELGGSEVVGPASKFFLRGSWNQFSSATDEAYRFYGSGNTLTFTIENFEQGKPFMIFDDNGKFYAIESTNVTVVKGSGLNDYNENYNNVNYKMFQTTDTNDKIATFILTLNNGVPERLDVETKEKAPVFTDDPSRAGNVYLVASQLNDNRITPEWMMTPDATGSNFTLTNFAMRSYKSGGNQVKAGWPSVVWYEADGTVHVKMFENLENLPDVSNNLTPGWAYTATFNLEGESLVMAPMSGDSFSEYGKDVLPYVGLLGKNFIQSTKYKTAGDYGNNPSNTSAGWQEAYIQYDASGQPVLDEAGAAYYNTYWPPRNNILMQSYLGEDVDPLNTSVDALTFTLDRRLAKSTSEWKEVLSGEEYVNLELEEGKSYYRYVIPSMWILGDFKLWTGWAGQHASWGAQWDHHIFWGPKDTNKTIASRTTYFPTVKEGTKDYSTGTERMYYQTVELFIPVSGEPGQQATSFDFYNARLYMTEAAGGAEIDSKTLNKHGGYYPKLDVFPSGYHLSGYKITRYQYDPNAVSGTYLPCDKQGNTGVSGIVVEKSGIKYADAKRFAEDFTVPSGVFQRYVDDNEYAPGLYIYSLDVEFTNELGEVRTDKVWSPYIEILDDDITLTLRNAQLIELPADNNYGGYSHVTYSASGDRVLVKIENDKVVRAGRLNDLLSGDELTAAVAEIYENTGAWTNMTLLRTAKPSKYTQQGGKEADITAFTISKSGTVVADMKSVTPIDGYRYAIYDNGVTFGTQNFTAVFNASFSTENEGMQAVNATATTTYQPRFMLPGFRSCGVGLNGAPMPYNDAYTATHDRIKPEGVSSSTHTMSLTALLSIAMPRVSDKTTGLREAVLNAIAVKLALDGGTPSSLKADTEFLSDNTIMAGLEYFYQSPYDWMELVNPAAELDKREWKAIPHSWSLDGTAYAEGIEGVNPTLSTPSATLALNPSFFAPTVDGIQVYKTNVPVEGKENAYVTKIMLRSANVVHTSKDMDPEHADRVDEQDSYMPVNQYSNYIVVSKDNGSGDFCEGDVMTHDVAQNAEVHHHVWTSEEFPYFAGMGDIRPDLTLYLSYAYVFKARPAGFDDPTGYLGLQGDFPYLRYDRKAQAAGAPARVASGSASTTLADDDDSFIFDPMYVAFDMNDIQTDVEGIEVAGQTIVAGQGFIDLMGVQGVVYASDGRQVYAGDSRVDVATGVYVVKTAGETLKVIVK